MLKKLPLSLFGIILLCIPAVASAHVVVTPNTANVGQELVFNISVPNEQQTAVTDLKLAVPAGVSGVIPTAKDGWTINTTSTGSGDSATVSTIEWSMGQIPVGQRQDFSFSAQVPSKATNIDWKAYQTYADGTVVHWDQKPAGSDDATGNAGPFSVTKVTNDLTATSAAPTTMKANTTLPTILSFAAIILAAAALMFRKK